MICCLWPCVPSRPASCSPMGSRRGCRSWGLLGLGDLSRTERPSPPSHLDQCPLATILGHCFLHLSHSLSRNYRSCLIHLDAAKCVQVHAQARAHTRPIRSGSPDPFSWQAVGRIRKRTQKDPEARRRPERPPPPPLQAAPVYEAA